jgi:hypothetical protein
VVAAHFAGYFWALFQHLLGEHFFTQSETDYNIETGTKEKTHTARRKETASRNVKTRPNNEKIPTITEMKLKRRFYPTILKSGFRVSGWPATPF